MADQLLLICGSVRAGSSNAAVLRTAGLLAPPDVEVVGYDELAALPALQSRRRRRAAARRRGPVAPAAGRGRRAAVQHPRVRRRAAGIVEEPVGLVDRRGRDVGQAGRLGQLLWGGPTGAAGAYAELRTVLTYADATIVEQACVQVPVTRSDVGPDGLVADPAARAQLAAAVAALVTVSRPA